MGKAYLGCKSGKQKVGSPSSNDAEIIAISDVFKNLKWIDNLLIEIELMTTIRHLYQDNLSRVYAQNIRHTIFYALRQLAYTPSVYVIFYACADFQI